MYIIRKLIILNELSNSYLVRNNERYLIINNRTEWCNIIIIQLIKESTLFTKQIK